MTPSEIIGTIGVSLLLLAYLLDLTGRLPNGKPVSLAINALGAGLACASAYMIEFWPFVVLEGVWAAVSVAGFLRPNLGGTPS